MFGSWTHPACLLENSHRGCPTAGFLHRISQAPDANKMFWMVTHCPSQGDSSHLVHKQGPISPHRGLRKKIWSNFDQGSIGMSVRQPYVRTRTSVRQSSVLTVLPAVGSRGLFTCGLYTKHVWSCLDSPSGKLEQMRQSWPDFGLHLSQFQCENRWSHSRCSKLTAPRQPPHAPYPLQTHVRPRAL